MNYPDENTVSKPVVGEEAKRLLDAVNSGRAMTDERAATTVARILKNHSKSAHEQSDQQVRRRDV
jgi:hypothetical protein